jgi:hypothetical protein
MNQYEAFKETLDLCRPNWPAVDEDFLSLEHHNDMLRRIDESRFTSGPSMSEAKMGRWLGWLQGVASALGLLTLDECKRINMKWSD